MANQDLIDFFYFSQKKKTNLKELIRQTQNKSIYETLRSWLKYGYIRRIVPDAKNGNSFKRKRKGATRRIYELTVKGGNYISYKREFQSKAKDFATTIKEIEKRY